MPVARRRRECVRLERRRGVLAGEKNSVLFWFVMPAERGVPRSVRAELTRCMLRVARRDTTAASSCRLSARRIALSAALSRASTRPRDTRLKASMRLSTALTSGRESEWGRPRRAPPVVLGSEVEDAAALIAGVSAALGVVVNKTVADPMAEGSTFRVLSMRNETAGPAR